MLTALCLASSCRFTGTEIVELLKPGNVIVTSKDRCDEHIELMKKHPDIKEMLSHWHKSVMCVHVHMLRTTAGPCL